MTNINKTHPFGDTAYPDSIASSIFFFLYICRNFKVKSIHACYVCVVMATIPELYHVWSFHSSWYGSESARSDQAIRAAMREDKGMATHRQ